MAPPSSSSSNAVYERVSTSDPSDRSDNLEYGLPSSSQRPNRSSSSLCGLSSLIAPQRIYLTAAFLCSIILIILFSYGVPFIHRDLDCSLTYSPSEVIAALDRAAAIKSTEQSKRDRSFMYDSLASLGPRDSCPSDHYAENELCIGYCSNIAETMKSLNPLRFSLSKPASSSIKDAKENKNDNSNNNHVCHLIPTNPSILFPLLRERICQPDESTLPDRCAHWSVWDKNEASPSSKPPCWSTLGDRVRAAMSLNGKVSVDQQHSDENTTPQQFTMTAEQIDEYRPTIQRIVQKMEQNNNNWKPIPKEEGGQYGSYQSDIFLLPALKKYQYGFKGLRVAVFGSRLPWVEAALIELGVDLVVTVEYTPIKTTHPKHRSMLPWDVAKQVTDGTLLPFDAAVSFSSLEHDGLGRYGDPINPFGDLQTFVKTSCILAPGAFFLWASPIRTDDHLDFNLHRIYGKYRLPLVLRNWHVVDVIDATEQQYQRWISGEDPDEIQFVFVLQNRIGCTAAEIKQPDA